MTDELREKAKAFRINSTSKFRPDYMLSTNMAEQLMADFAAECVRAERERIVKELDDKVFPFNNDERHDMTDPCLVCEILDTLDAISAELRGDK